jgi:hypothetical protein
MATMVVCSMGFTLVLKTMTLKASGFMIDLQTIHTFRQRKFKVPTKELQGLYGKSLLSSLSFQSTLAPLSSCIFWMSQHFDIGARVDDKWFNKLYLALHSGVGFLQQFLSLVATCKLPNNFGLAGRVHRFAVEMFKVDKSRYGTQWLQYIQTHVQQILLKLYIFFLKKRGRAAPIWIFENFNSNQ